MAKKADQEIYIADVALMLSANTRSVMVRSALVEQTSSGPKLSGKDMSLTMTQATAMKLLRLLLDMQKAHNLPEHSSEVERTIVPPSRDQN